jgi:hypothetical protein
MILCSTVASIAITAPVLAADAADTANYSFAAVPLVSYSSDLGLGVGLRAFVQRRLSDDASPPMALEAQGFAMTGGTQLHFLHLDLPGLIDAKTRLDVLAGYSRSTAAPYYGIGNHAPPPSSTPTSFYSYTESAPLIRLRLRRHLWGPLSLLLGYRLVLDSVEVAPDTLLAAQAPLGTAGDRFSEIAVGLAFDTRDEELSPTNGVLIEGTLRATAPVLGASQSSLGSFFSASAYRTLAPRLVLAGRVAVDAIWGDVPFDRLQDFGSLVSPFFLLDGVGGATTVRGLIQSEYIGHTKAIGNLELRWQFLQISVWNQQVGLSALAFADAGRVWDGPDPADLPNLGLHVGTGGGLRIAWGKTVLLRADAGFAEGRVRLYADFGHVF